MDFFFSRSKGLPLTIDSNHSGILSARCVRESVPGWKGFCDGCGPSGVLGFEVSLRRAGGWVEEGGPGLGRGL